MNKCPYCKQVIPSYTRTCPECNEVLPLYNRILDRFNGSTQKMFEFFRKILGQKESTIKDVIATILVIISMIIIVYLSAAPFTIVKMLIYKIYNPTYFVSENIFSMFILYVVAGIIVILDYLIRSHNHSTHRKEHE